MRSNSIVEKTKELISITKGYYEQLNPPSPAIIGKISGKDLADFLSSYVDKDATLLLVDSHYKLTTEEELDKALRAVLPEAWRYIDDYSDCDDSAFRLTGLLSTGKWAWLAMGLTFGDRHAFFSAVLKGEDELKFRIVEPQAKHGDIFDYEEAKNKRIYVPIWFLMY